MKVCILGAGNIATTVHIPCFKAIDSVELVGICDPNEAKVKKIANDFDIPFAFINRQQMYHDIKPDVVSICVPNKHHCMLAIEALQNGCNVLCEKPPAMNFAEAFLMENTAKEKHKLLSYDFQHRFTEEYKYAYNVIKNGDLGVISHAQAKWLRRRGIPNWGCFTDKSIQGGGPLIDIGVHMLDATISLLEYPEVSYVCSSESDTIGKLGGIGDFGPWDGNKYSVEDSSFSQIFFKNYTSLTLETSFALNMKEQNLKEITIFGSTEGISLFPLEVYKNGKTESIKTSELQNPRFALITNFINACAGNEPLNITAKQGTYIQKLIEILYQSAETHKPIFWN